VTFFNLNKIETKTQFIVFWGPDIRKTTTGHVYIVNEVWMWMSGCGNYSIDGQREKGDHVDTTQWNRSRASLREGGQSLCPNQFIVFWGPDIRKTTICSLASFSPFFTTSIFAAAVRNSTCRKTLQFKSFDCHIYIPGGKENIL
jgi:hypothetical protein